MSEFIQLVLRLPTVVFTGLMLLAILYWLGVVFGVIDVDGDGGGGAMEIGRPGAGLKEFSDGVPLGMVASGWAFWGFVLTSFGDHFGRMYLPEVAGSRWFPLSWLLLSGGLAALLAVISVSPLRVLFRVKQGRTAESMVGMTCVIRTGRVDAEFGQADVDGNLVNVRCRGADALRRGSKARIVDYDETAEVFYVEALET